MYSYVPPPGKNIPISVQPFPVDDSVPTEDEIEWAVKQLCNNRSRGASGMLAEHLKRWLTTGRKANKDKETAGKEEAATTTERARTDILAAQKETDSDNWMRVVDLVQSAFLVGNLTEEVTWQAVVRIYKGKKEDRHIGIVEVMWKVVAAPAQDLHHLPRFPPWVPGRSRDRYRHPQGQAASTACGI